MVGGGPAGLAAAAWLGRHRRRTLLVDAGQNRNRFTEKVHGYLGLDPVAPGDLLRRGREALSLYESVECREGEVTGVERIEGGFALLGGGWRHTAGRVVLATGVEDELPELDGFSDHYGADAFHCSYCDGYEARGRRVAVLGWAHHATQVAEHLLDWAAEVTLLSDGRELEGGEARVRGLRRRGIEVEAAPAQRLLGERHGLRGIGLADGRTLAADFLFFYLGRRPRNGLARELGCALDRGGYVRTDRNGRTSVPGVFAAGDLTPGLQFVQHAAADGAAAGITCARGRAVR